MSYLPLQVDLAIMVRERIVNVVDALPLTTAQHAIAGRDVLMGGLSEIFASPEDAEIDTGEILFTVACALAHFTKADGRPWRTSNGVTVVMTPKVIDGERGVLDIRLHEPKPKSDNNGG